jgi:hypothetical protein
MNAKTRLKQLEKTSGAGKHTKVIVMQDALDDGLATFDGVKMTQAEAEAKAAEFDKRDDVLLIHVAFASGADT